MGIRQLSVLEQVTVFLEELLVNLSLHVFLVHLLNVVLDSVAPPKPLVTLGAEKLQVVEMLGPEVRDQLLPVGVSPAALWTTVLLFMHLFHVVHQGLAVKQLRRGVFLGRLGAQIASKGERLVNPFLVGPQVLCRVE